MNTHLKLALILSISSVSMFSACSASSKYEPSGNPLLDLRNPELLERDRIAAATAAWSEVEQGIRDREPFIQTADSCLSIHTQILEHSQSRCSA